MTTTGLNIRVGERELVVCEDVNVHDVSLDSRGVVWLWEKPSPRFNYVVACDPSYGLPGWDRNARITDDTDTDNSAIEVLRCGTTVTQVAEYAGPIDPEDAAAVVNFLGRMYGGADENEQARTIVEVQPGPGLLTQRELINRYGYVNLFQWQHLDAMNIKPTQSYGWYSSRQSRQMLWIRGVRAIKKKQCTIRSPWLIDEMADAVPDAFLNFTARAKWGCHDDRLLAFLLGLWAANEWTWENVPDEQDRAVDVKAPDAQHSDMTYEEMVDDWNERTTSIFD